MTDLPTSDDTIGAEEPIMRYEVVSPTLDQLRTVLSEMGDDVDLGCRSVARRHEQGYAIEILAPSSRLEAARASRSADGVTFTEVENATEASRARQAEVAHGNRFEQRGQTPRGLGVKE